MLKHRGRISIRALTPAIVALPCLFLGADFSAREDQSVERPGAIDPTIRGNPGPATNQVLGKVRLGPDLGENKLVNDRSLCPNGRGLTQNETSLAVSGNVVVAAFNDSRGVCDPDNHAIVGWAYCLDRGDTWVDGGGLPSSRNLNNGDPWVGVSPDGQTFYLSGLWNFYSGFGFYRGTVTETGIEWSQPTVISFSPLPTHDKEAFAVDPNSGTIYLTYTYFLGLPAGIYATRSDDQGQNWSPPVPVNMSGHGSFPVVDNQGNLYVAYQVGATIGVSKSTDRGDTFDRLASFPYQSTAVTFMDRSSQFPQLAVDITGGDRDGWVYVVWHGGAGLGATRPYISHSEDGGATWTDPTPINTDDVVAYHWWPSVTVDASGNVNVIFLDRRNNPGTGLTDCFFAQSVDGGNTFADTQITDVTSSWQGIMYDPLFTYAGDYIRAVSQGTSVYALWTDPRNGDPDIYFSRIDAAGFAARAKR